MSTQSSVSDAVPANAPRSVWDLVRSARGSMYLGFTLAALGAVFKVVPYIAIVEITRSLLAGNPDSAHLWGWVIAAVVCMVVHSLSYTYALGNNHTAEARLRHELRQRLIGKLGVMNLGWFSARSSGRIRQAVSNDTADIHSLVAHLAGDFANSLISLLVSLGYLFWLDWRFAGLLIGCYLLLSVVVYATGMTGIRKVFDDYAEAERQLSDRTVELVDGIKEVKNFGMTAEVFGRFDEAQKRFSKVSLVWMQKQSIGLSLIASLLRPGPVFAATMGLGLVFTLQGWLSPVTVVAFALVWVGLPEGLLTLMEMSQNLYAAKQAANSTLHILQAPELSEPNAEIAPEEEAPAVEFRDVSFSYDPGEPVIQELSLKCPPGTVTALVGPSGGGKSTLARLIARFWDVDSGTVLVNGRDVRDQPSRELLSSMSLVFQDVMLSTDTVRANIALGNADATEHEIEEAARAACIHDRIMQLPDGYGTIIGEGAHLSGGEAQRLTIARAFLAASPILILDEATAQADSHSECLIQQAISNLAQKRTVIVIAHRLSTIQGVDQIAVIDAGRLVELGTHDDLLTQDGPYARLWRNQTNIAHALEGLRGKEQAC
ncbi:ABC transporter ATP-binding protein [Arachnia propionica]|uniref:ABC transporter ATP-binding protein n=1 Tax=Arachnia propionica TaxID=1750 RepID=A0AB37HSU4_9ACTN|nr:ABC transporter ATP-binding protein [Arachnia propionica]AFN46617.1 ABC transporter transmembrane region [Arachnia propionica F0230a]QCT37106.1 ABC transporter ATP-binding protein [Arachnia propionica]QUC10551.1 ABC transporter ATP-binding protein [Arachnia propionica]RPA17442.1 ABC transporter ATP-binding protein [Arachnia propionica]